jgi:hypothetical protein
MRMQKEIRTGSFRKRQEILQRKCPRYFWQAWRPVFRRSLKETVGDCEESNAGGEEEAAVQSGEFESSGAMGHSQP